MPAARSLEACVLKRERLSFVCGHFRPLTPKNNPMRPIPHLSARCRALTVMALLASALAAPAALAAAEPEVSLVIRNHRFEPSEVRVPAGQKVRLVVDNQDATAEEFESKALKREK